MLDGYKKITGFDISVKLKPAAKTESNDNNVLKLKADQPSLLDMPLVDRDSVIEIPFEEELPKKEVQKTAV
jgi:hypothetical protein